MAVLFRQWQAAFALLLGYALLLLLWRFAFTRLLSPVVPFILIAILSGASAVMSRLSPFAARAAMYAIGVLLAVGSIRQTLPRLAAAVQCDRTLPSESPTCWPTEDRDLLKLAGWVRDSTEADAIFLVPKEHAFFFHTGRRSINQDQGLSNDSSSLKTYLQSRGVTYAVVTPIGERPRHNRLIARACADFDVVKKYSSRTILLRVRDEPAISGGPACEALAEYRTQGR
jgi:hypothetical protein